MFNGRKINYHDFLCSGINVDCNHALKRMIERIELKKINQLIEGNYLYDIPKSEMPPVFLYKTASIGASLMIYFMR